MKKLIWIIAIAMVPAIATAQAGKKTKLERKLERQETLAVQKEQLKQLADERNLVIEATTIYNRHGFNATVAQNNFVMVDSADFVLQTSSPTRIAQNGMGGITIRGTISSYEVKQATDKAPIVITAQVKTFGLGGGTLIIRLNSAQNAQATFTTNMGDTITFSGPVTSVEESSVFKGMNLY